jgi:hypothetical protein
LTQSIPINWTIKDGEIFVPQGGQYGNTQPDYHALLNHHELKEILLTRDKLTQELKGLNERLSKLAPHLFQNV